MPRDHYIDTKIKTGPLDELPDALRNCWSTDELSRLYREIYEDKTKRLAAISARMDSIRGS